MREKPLRLGLIGCGRVARYHAQALTEIEGSRLVAVCDIVPERADDFSRRYGGDAYYDHRELLERKDVDVVCIATPSGDHPAIGIDAARAGKHVVVEKPIGLTLKEIDDLIDACRSQNVKLCTVHQNRFNPAIAKLREAFEQGKFGRLSHGSVAVLRPGQVAGHVETGRRGSDESVHPRHRSSEMDDGKAAEPGRLHCEPVPRY